jgi:TolA-binding protein
MRIRRHIILALAVCATWGLTAPAQAAESSSRPRLTIDNANRLLASGRAAFEDGLYPLAQRRLEEVVEGAPDRRRQAEGALWLARVHLAEQKPEAALALLETYNSYSRSLEMKSGYAEARAQARYDLGQMKQAAAELADFSGDYAEQAIAPRALLLLSRVEAARGRWDKARESCEQLVARYPNGIETPSAWIELGTALANEGRMDEALEVLSRLEAMEQHPVWGERATLKVVELQLSIGDREKAMERLRTLAANPNLSPATRAQGYQIVAQALGSESNYPAALEMIDWGIAGAADPAQRLESQGVKARLLLLSGQVEEGVELMRSVAAQVPDESRSAQLQLGLADGLAQLEQWEEASAEYQAWLDAFEGREGSAEALAGYGWVLWSSGHPEEAAALYERAVAAETDTDRRLALQLKLADAQFASGQFSKAKATYLAALEHLSEGAESAGRTQLQLAETELALGEIEAGEIRLIDLSREEADSSFSRSATMRLGMLYEERGALETAMEQYGRLIEACPEPEACSEALLARGLIRYRMGSFQLALDDFIRIRDEFPETRPAAQSMFMRGWCLYLLGKDADALQVCEQFLEAYPESIFTPDVRFWLGEHAFNQGEYEIAESRFASVASDHPDSPRAADALFWAGRAATARRAYLEANEHYNALMARYPDSDRLAGTFLAQGDVLSELGQFAAAILAFDEVIVKFPQEPEAMMAWGRKGDCQYTLGQDDPGRYEEALLSYRMLLDFAGAPVDLRLQAGYKIGRCLEKMGRSTASLDRYMEVVYSFLQETDAPAEATVWFTRAAFAAAALQEQAGQWKEAVGIYGRVADSGVAAAPEARDRMDRIQEDHWVLF